MLSAMMLQAETKEAAVKALLDTAMQMYDLEHFEIMHEELLETRVDFYTDCSRSALPLAHKLKESTCGHYSCRNTAETRLLVCADIDCLE